MRTNNIFIYLDDIGDGSLLVGVRVKLTPLGPAQLSGRTKRSGLLSRLSTVTGESHVTELPDEISITSSSLIFKPSFE